MKKITYKNKVDVEKTTWADETQIIRAQDMNELKTAINTNADELTTLLNQKNALQSEIASLKSQISTLNSELSTLKGKIPTSTSSSLKKPVSIKKTGKAPSYNNEVNIYYLTPSPNDLVIGINITVKFKTGDYKTVNFVPNENDERYRFSVVSNKDNYPWIWYFEARPNNNSISNNGWRDLYVKFLGGHSVYNAGWDTSNSTISEIIVTTMFIPA
ncbi:hypothetical protein [Mycoplasma seminis]|uniref:Uncharacterized protein n=1 Tax=Mycoplasma seminis TaxID=512749 RepID=A0ABY9H9M0_9MOLU|nr:hypothetical protein [Mycoplasma seminis]WLP85279.1 hypothetical protein Q8852_03070 [Mycoplasma seminis]